MTTRVHRSERSAATVVAVVVVLLSAVVGVVAESSASAATGARGKPDLVIVKVRALPTTAVAGDAMPVTVVVRNQGERRSPKSTLSFSVSKDRSTSGTDLALPVSIEVPRIKAGTKKQVSGTLTAPEDVKGARYVIACVAQVRGEKRKAARNNCTAAKNTVDIRPQSTGGELPAYLVGTSTAQHTYTVTSSATDAIGATYEQVERTVTATGVVFELGSTLAGSPRYVAVDGEIEWRMDGGYVWPDETCDFAGTGTVALGARPAGTPYSMGYVMPSSSVAGLGRGAGYSLSTFHHYNGGEAPSYDLECTEYDKTRKYLIDPWLTVRTDHGESSACEWTSTVHQFNVLPDGSLTGENSCRNFNTRDYDNGTHHEYTFESRVSWDLEPLDALPVEARR